MFIEKATCLASGCVCESGSKNKKVFCGKKKRPGFTLIEMIVVISIIGILAGIIAIRFSDAQKNAKVNADYANASNIATAAYMSMGDGKLDQDSKNLETLKTNKYIQSVPKPQSKDGDFTIEITDGEVIVKAGNDVFYPKPEAKKEGK